MNKQIPVTNISCNQTTVKSRNESWLNMNQWKYIMDFTFVADNTSYWLKKSIFAKYFTQSTDVLLLQYYWLGGQWF